MTGMTFGLNAVALGEACEVILLGGAPTQGVLSSHWAWQTQRLCMVRKCQMPCSKVLSGSLDAVTAGKAGQLLLIAE